MGRLTLNPLPHIDPFMTILLPIVLYIAGGPVFGGAKPVPINPFNLRNPRKDMIWIGLAGPASNLVMALGFALIFHGLVFLDPRITFIIPQILRLSFDIPKEFGLATSIITPLAFLSVFGVFVNVILAFFNLIPIPPLDGSRLLIGLVPEKVARGLIALEPFGFIVVYLLFLAGIIQIFLIPALYLVGLLLF
jgi:Zn-dependent protease